MRASAYFTLFYECDTTIAVYLKSNLVKKDFFWVYHENHTMYSLGRQEKEDVYEFINSGYNTKQSNQQD